MKRFPRLLMMALILGLLLAMAPYAGAEVYVADPGQTVTIYLEYTDICAIDGEISISDSSIISKYEYDTSALGMKGLVEGKKFFLYAGDQTGVSGRLGVTLTIFSGAQKGSSSTVTFRYNATAPGETAPGSTQTVTHTVTVRTDGAPSVTEPTTPPAPTTPSGTNYADTTALRAQLAIANALRSYDYTKESWAAVQSAVQKAQNLLVSSDQGRVDSATAQLKDALSKLVPMDYTALQQALENAAALDQHEQIAKLWSRFMQALDNARAQLVSGDQAAADAAAQELNDAKAALLDGLEEMGELVVVEKEVKVEPDEGFCNDKGHSVTVILLVISLAVNGALIATIGVYWYTKRRREKDTTPLVEYEENEDEVEINEDLLE